MPIAVLATPIFLSGCSFEETALAIDTATSFLDKWEAINQVKDGIPQQQESFTLEILNWVFKLVSNIIWTPAFIFDNDWFRGMLAKFSLISVGLVTIFSIFEGFKRILNLKNTTDLGEIARRFPLAIAVCGFAPLAFVKAIELLNKVTQYIINLATGMISTQQFTMSPLSTLDQVGLFLFNILFIALCIPIVLHHGRRWFDMLVLGVLTPFAMCAYIFNSFSKFHRDWWNNLKSLYLVQLVYAIFFSLMSVIMFAVPFPETFQGSVAKMLILLGGFWRMAFPPSFVTRMTDSGEDSVQRMKKLGKFAKDKNQKFQSHYQKGKKGTTRTRRLLTVAVGRKFPFLRNMFK